MLADTAGEDDKVDSVHLGYVGTDDFDHVVGELLEDKFGLGVAGVGEFVHVAAVGCLAGEAEEAGFLVEDFAHLVGSETFFLHEVEHGVGIDVADAGTHDHALERGESHGCLN